MKIIFLDIDGVLNSTTDFMESYYFKGSINYQKSEVISPGKLCLLEEIIKQTDAKIVISSTWRETYSLKELFDLFVERGWSLPVTAIVGKTKNTGFRLSDMGEHCGRTHRISEWLDSKDNITSYVILDDMAARSFEERHQNNLVLTTVNNGLNLDDAEKAIDILGRNEEYQKKQDESDKTSKITI